MPFFIRKDLGTSQSVSRGTDTDRTWTDGQVDSPELPETPENTEMKENFTKVTKYLIKFKETLINYVWEKSHIKKK